MSNDDAASRAAIPESARPLPAKPSLEFERKRAKKMLRELRAADPAAKLTDAQFAIAREYGFTSWPRLVEYFETMHRHEVSDPPGAWYPLDVFERQAQGLLQRKGVRHVGVALALARFVPRFYARPLAEILSTPLTSDDARLLTARQNRMPSWEALAEFAAHRQEGDGDGWKSIGSTSGLAHSALQAKDLRALAEVVDTHPELLQRPPRTRDYGGELLVSALTTEWKEQSTDARRVTDWLVARGADLQGTLNRLLTRFIRAGSLYARGRDVLDWVKWVIARGGDPAWVAPNGLTVLEHMILGRVDPKVVDYVATLVAPPRALWVAAGLGDVRAVNRHFDRNGKLTRAAHRNRPDAAATGHGGVSLHLDASDDDVMWEAAYIAAENGRYAALDALISHGLPIDYAPIGFTLLYAAVNMHNVELVEFLVARGASADIKGASPAMLDQWLFEHDPNDAKARRIYELCGGTSADAVLERHKARPVEPVTPGPHLLEALDIAKDEAARQGHAEVQPEDLFFAMLRQNHAPLGFIHGSGADAVAFKRSVEHRLIPVVKGQTVPDIPLSQALKAIMDAARAESEARRYTHFNTHGLIKHLLARDEGEPARLIRAAGGSLEQLRAEFARG